MPFNNNENGIAHIEEGMEEGYQLKFASWTSRFSGDTVPILEDAGIWNDLREVNYVSTLRGGKTIQNIKRSKERRYFIKYFATIAHSANLSEQPIDISQIPCRADSGQ